MSIGIWQIAIVVILLVLLFGRGKISSLMGDVAKGIKSFKKGMATDITDNVEPKDISESNQDTKDISESNQDTKDISESNQDTKDISESNQDTKDISESNQDTKDKE